MDDEILAQDLPKLLQLVGNTVERVKGVREHVAKLKEHIAAEMHNPESGISLLELKFQLLLSYVINLVQVMLSKSNGQCISGSPALHRLVEIRTVLEKIRPLDQKLKYQVDKLVRTAATGMASASDPLRFKPNPSNLVSKLEEAGSSDEVEDTSSEQKLYVPPRVVSAPYNESVSKGEGKKRQRMALVEELREEVLDMPSEVKTSVVVGGVQRRKELAKEKELERFEESNMIRLSRKRKSHDTGRSNRQELDELTDFTEFKSVTGSSGDQKSRRKKQTSKKKRSFRRRR